MTELLKGVVCICSHQVLSTYKLIQTSTLNVSVKITNNLCFLKSSGDSQPSSDLTDGHISQSIFWGSSITFYDKPFPWVPPGHWPFLFRLHGCLPSVWVWECPEVVPRPCPLHSCTCSHKSTPKFIGYKIIYAFMTSKYLSPPPMYSNTPTSPFLLLISYILSLLFWKFSSHYHIQSQQV